MPFSPAYPDSAALSPAYPSADVLGPAYPTGFQDLWSAQFTSASTQSANMTDANFGAFDRTTFAIAIEATRDSTGAAQVMFNQAGGAATRSFSLEFTAADKILFRWSTAADGGTTLRNMVTTATYTSGTKYNILVLYDSTNATVSDKVRIFVGGVRIAAFDTDDTGFAGTAFNSSHQVNIGIWGTTTTPMNGRLNHLSFWSGTFPAYSDIWDGSDNAIDVSGKPGLWSNVEFEDNWADGVLVTDWTPVNAPPFVSN